MLPGGDRGGREMMDSCCGRVERMVSPCHRREERPGSTCMRVEILFIVLRRVDVVLVL